LHRLIGNHVVPSVRLCLRWASVAWQRRWVVASTTVFSTDFLAFVIVHFFRRSLAALPSGALRLIAPARSRIVVRFRPNQFSVLILRLTKLAGLRPRFQAVAVALQPVAAAESAPFQVAAVAESTSQQVAAVAESASLPAAALPAQE